MNDEGEGYRNSDEHKGPWATELGGHGSCCREEHEDLEDTAPLGCPLLEVSEHDIADREDRCDQGDFEPGIHMRRRGECRGLTPRVRLQSAFWTGVPMRTVRYCSLAHNPMPVACQTQRTLGPCPRHVARASACSILRGVLDRAR